MAVSDLSDESSRLNADRETTYGLFPLYALSLTTCVSISLGIAVGFLVYRFAPLHDRIEVVGPPLLRGYSEANEQFGFYAFWLACLVLPFFVHRSITKRSSKSVLIAGAAGLLLICLPAWMINMQTIRRPFALPLGTLVSCAGFIIGCWVGASSSTQSLMRRNLWVPGLVLWCIGFPTLTQFFATDVRLLSGFVVFALIIARFCKRATWRPPFGFGVWIATGVVCAGISMSQTKPLFVASVGFVMTTLGMSLRLKGRTTSVVDSARYLVSVTTLLVFVYALRRYIPNEWWLPPLWALGGIGAALILSEPILKVILPRFELVVARSNARWLFSAVVASLVALVFVDPWYGCLVLAAVFLMRRKQRRTGFLVATAFAAALFTLMLPTGDFGRSLLDPIHDGSVLSSVWEFETGRALFSEVFPLRTYQFFVCWIGRQFFPPTLQGYHFSLAVLAGLPLASVALMTFAWTRSLVWSFATGITLSALYAFRIMDSRQAMQLLVAAIAIEVLRSNDRRKWGLLCVPAAVAALVGYDCILPLLFASVAATFVVPRLQRRFHRERVSLRARLIAPTSVALIQLVPVTVLLIAWQESESAIEYWSMLVEYAQNYTSASGRPIEWGLSEDRYLIASCIAVVGVWTAVASVLWSRMSDRSRRLSVFVVVHYFFQLHRGIGRSYTDYWTELVCATFILTSIGLFELIRALRRAGLRSVWTNWQVLAFCAIAIFCRLSYVDANPPWGIVKSYRSLKPQEEHHLEFDEFVPKTVAEDESIWAFEYAITYYAHRRHSPTRHSLAMCIVSPEEQRRVVDEFRANPPRLIQWQYDPRSDVMKSTDGVPRTVRYYVLTQYLFQNYKPTPFVRSQFQFGFLEPAEPNWQGVADYPDELKAEMPLGRLPLIWGERRVPLISDRIKKRRTVSNTTVSRVLQIGESISPRDFNYLAVEISSDSDEKPRHAILEFAVDGAFESETKMTFDVAGDGESHRYLIPIGCNPAWSWRSTVQQARITSNDDRAFNVSNAELWFVDELQR